MDITGLLNTVPVLPPDGLLRVARPVMWAVVVAAVAARATQNLWQHGPESQVRKWAHWVAAAFALWCLLPSPWSLAYHLSLVFMLPSWLLVLLCGYSLWRSLFAIDSEAEKWCHSSEKSSLFLKISWAGAFFLGAVLLADTFVLLPFALYRWGFGSAAVALLAVAAALLWAASLPGSAARRHASLLALVLALHVVTRLPSGNVFDAVLDPLLWAWMAWIGLSKVLKGAGFLSATTTRG